MTLKQLAEAIFKEIERVNDPEFTNSAVSSIYENVRIENEILSLSIETQNNGKHYNFALDWSNTNDEN